ncbi:hypothetical protein DQ04_13961020 [Trypanosoma grayi]|uniref:hypothetical protein n=1 Tax=Trypanosoma grayi TaxID=71804 RepID=UPI0004F3F4F6|nr:hypothetical protein DQ04_13961020 [Trypanosoma grayi]KEG06432.1 hypothetical protein DQ04_13961020 [Trypanosoma grayi]
MPAVTQAVSDTDGVVQKIKNAKAKADEALRYFDRSGAESTDAEAYTTNTEREANAAVEGARTAVAAALVTAEKAHEVALMLETAATKTDVAAKATKAAIDGLPTITEAPTAEQNKTLNDALKKSTKALNRARWTLWASKEVNTKDGEKSKDGAQQALASVEAKLKAAETSMQPIESARTSAEVALKSAQQELEQLKDKAHQQELEQLKDKAHQQELEQLKDKAHQQELEQLKDKAHRVEREETEEAKKKVDEPDHSQQPQTTAAPALSLNITAANSETLLAPHDDSSINDVAWVRAPLLLLLLACVAVW